jgi:hypothetical protein
MTGNVPPRIESPKTFIGVGLREVLILGAGGMVVIAVFLLPVHLAVRIGLAVLAAGLGLAMAFGRDRRSGKAPEEMIRDLIRFHRRGRLLQKGSGAPGVPDPLIGTPSGEIPHPAPTLEATSRREHARLRMKPLPLGPGLVLSVMSFSFLAAVLAWIWLGGMTQIQTWMMVKGF